MLPAALPVASVALICPPVRGSGLGPEEILRDLGWAVARQSHHSITGS